METETQIMQSSLARHLPTEPLVEQLAAARKGSAAWYAAYTNSHHEKRVASYLTERQIESFLPLYSTRRRWKNRCQMNLEMPLFPNYVFVHIDPRERVHVLEVPGVLSIVGSGRILMPLPDFEIETLRSGLGQRNIEPHPYLVVGEWVRIKAGPMMGMEGVLLRKKNNFRVVLALDVIMQSVAVEVDADDLEPASKCASRVVLRPISPGGPTGIQPCRAL
ncbi:MAG: UpxY family transcription antiterminator [Acidobacteriia bacterium]|nr:UpxY family transcription antiterminator [Terriglobia bacterium]